MFVFCITLITLPPNQTMSAPESDMSAIPKPTFKSLKYPKELCDCYVVFMAAKFTTTTSIMDFKWMSNFADRLNHPKLLNYDWSTVKKAIFEPNKAHLMAVNNWSEEKVEKFLEDGYVFLNSHGKPSTFEEDGETYNYPTLANFFADKDMEY